jgi:hypothetical protein
MMAILNDPLFGIVVHYLQGSPLSSIDLDRCMVATAYAVFIMGNKFSVLPDEDDAKTILHYFSIRRYVQTHTHHNDPLYCMQIIRPDNKRHLGSSDEEECKEVIICLNEMKMGLIAKTCTFPGTSTMIFNLLTSFADTGDAIEEEEVDVLPPPQAPAKKGLDPGGSLEEASDEELDGVENLEEGNQQEDSDSDDDLKNPYWMNEYQKGCDWEIYTTDMSDRFEGVKFIDLARKLYSKLGVILFSLRVTDLNSVNNKVRVVLNPADFVIPPKSRFKVEGFVIAKNQASSDLSFMGKGSEYSALEAISSSVTKTAFGISSGRKRVSIVSKKNQSLVSGWQTLIANVHEPAAEERVYQSRQERFQKLEDDYLKNNFFIRSSLPDLEECTIQSSLAEEYPYVQNHMIIIAKGISNLYDFIRPLRAKYLSKLNHIVLLFPFEIPVNIWRRISIFEGILYVRGSPLEENDMKRAGIFRAAQVVVLADPESTEHASESTDSLVDSDAIFTFHCVKRLNERAQIVVEIVRQQNVGYLDNRSSGIDYKFTPNFAAGTLFTSSMLDSVVCQVLSAFFSS